MNINEALQVAQASPLLSQFEPEKLGVLISTTNMLAYAAAHPQDSEPSFDQIQSFLEVNPSLLEICAKVTLCVLHDLTTLGLDKTPTHDDFANTIWAPVGSLLSIAATGELRPSLDQIEETMENSFIGDLIDRALTIIWILFYPGSPLANGEVHTLESFAQVCKDE